jgi:hypothetical protein
MSEIHFVENRHQLRTSRYKKPKKVQYSTVQYVVLCIKLYLVRNEGGINTCSNLTWIFIVTLSYLEYHVMIDTFVQKDIPQQDGVKTMSLPL